MKWGLYSRVAVSLGCVLCAAMFGLGYILLQASVVQFASNQLAQAKLSALTLVDEARPALQKNNHEQLSLKIQHVISDAEPDTQLAYAVAIFPEGRMLGVDVATGSTMTSLEELAPVGRIDLLQIRHTFYQGRPVREVVYPVTETLADSAKHLANIHVGHFEDIGPFSQGKRTSDIILTLVGIWLASMVVIFIALSRSIKPLSVLTQRITTTAFASPRRAFIDELSNRNDEVGVLACAFDALIANLLNSYLELKEREYTVRPLVETDMVIPWELDLNSRRITYVGPQITSILGYSVDEWSQEKFWFNHVYPEDLQMSEDFYRRVASGEEEKEIEYRMLHANGTVVWVRDWVHKSSKNPRSPILQGLCLTSVNA